MLEFDHVIPLAIGGSNTERNLQLLCGICNRDKSANLVQGFQEARHLATPVLDRSRHGAAGGALAATGASSVRAAVDKIAPSPVAGWLPGSLVRRAPRSQGFASADHRSQPLAPT